MDKIKNSAGKGKPGTGTIDRFAGQVIFPLAKPILEDL
jgi:hypothetical protein